MLIIPRMTVTPNGPLTVILSNSADGIAAKSARRADIIASRCCPCARSVVAWKAPFEAVSTISSEIVAPHLRAKIPAYR